MLAGEIKEKFPLVWEALQVIVMGDDTGFVVVDYELPDTYGNVEIARYLQNFNDWLSQFDGKLTSDVISVQDFKNHFDWSDDQWASYNSYDEWEKIYSKDSAISSFASSEESVMEVITKKYNGGVYGNFLVDCFDNVIRIFCPTCI